MGIVASLLLVTVFTGACIVQASDPTPAEEIKAKQRLLIAEAWNKGNLDVCDEVFAADIVDHNPPWFTPEIWTPEVNKDWIAETRAIFGDFQFTIDDLIAEGDTTVRCVMRWTITGSHTGKEFQGVPPTGKQVTIIGCSVSYWVDGKIVERWHYVGFLGMYLQLGFKLVPPEVGG